MIESTQRFHFGEFQFDPVALELRRRWRKVEVSSRPLRVLSALCRAGGRFVTKDELLKAVWDTTHVSEASVFTAIRQLRRALGDSGAEQCMIETQRKRGYRLRPPIEDSPVGAVATAPDFVGRQGPLVELETAWRAARNGRGGIVLIAGEAGIGKTRVVEEFLRFDREALRAWCWGG